MAREVDGHYDPYTPGLATPQGVSIIGGFWNFALWDESNESRMWIFFQ